MQQYLNITNLQKAKAMGCTDVVTACNTSQEAITTAFDQYHAVDTNDECPSYLQPQSCASGKEQTKTNFVKVVDQGDTAAGLGAVGAPSCTLMVTETVNRANDELGDKAGYLPDACEKMQ